MVFDQRWSETGIPLWGRTRRSKKRGPRDEWKERMVSALPRAPIYCAIERNRILRETLDDDYFAGAAFAWLRFDNYLNVAPEYRQKPHQAFKRKSAEPPSH